MLSLGKIRDIRENELELMLSWRNTPSIRKNMYNRHIISINEHLTWWNSVRNENKNKYFMYENSDQPLGIIGFNNIDNINKNSSWAFYASPEAPKGTGTLMEILALDYAFNELGLHKLYCEVLSFNSPVIKLHKKFGFIEEGIFREHHKTDDNKFVDIHRFGLLSNEWNGMRKKILKKIERAFGG